jgi:hypothetical protein
MRWLRDQRGDLRMKHLTFARFYFVKPLQNPISLHWVYRPSSCIAKPISTKTCVYKVVSHVKYPVTAILSFLLLVFTNGRINAKYIRYLFCVQASKFAGFVLVIWCTGNAKYISSVLTYMPNISTW